MAGERVAAMAKQTFIQFENPNKTIPFQVRGMTHKASNSILQLYLTQGQQGRSLKLKSEKCP